MARPIRIRDAVPEDAEAIAAMCRELATSTAVAGGVPMTARGVVDDLVFGQGLSLLTGLLDGRAAGYALYSVAYETAWSARGLYVSDLFVAANARRRGLARALMAELARRARAEGGSFLWWITKPANTAAVGFYASLGAVPEPLSAMALHGAAFDSLLAGQ